MRLSWHGNRKLRSNGYAKGRSAAGKSGQRRASMCLSRSFVAEVRNGAWIRAVVALFAQRKFSILLDSRPHKEQYEFEVSPFGARLPLLSPFAVSLKDKLRIERQQGRTYQVLFYSSRGALPPVRRAGLHTQTPAVSGHIAQAQLATCE
jgi:hypothetical protein